MRWARNLSISILLIGSLSACSNSGSNSQQSGPTPSATTTTSVAQSHEVMIFFVGDTPQGFRLFPEVQTIKVAGELSQSVMRSLISGELKPKDPDYVNLWRSGSKLNTLTVNGGLATIDLSLGKLNVGSEGEMRAIDQLVWTITEIDHSIMGVKFTVDGRTVESFAGHVDTRGTFKREPSYEVLSPVSIISPVQAALLKNPIVVAGEACTFEANVAWELLKDGKSIDKGSTLAQIACPDRSPWKLALPRLDNGSYTIIARDYSAKDGSITAVDSKDFKVAK
jgi:hypothetical protein